MTGFTHLNEQGQALMVDVSDKVETTREARALTRVTLPVTIANKLLDQSIPKGDVFSTARIAGIQGAKRCADLIPLCHPLPISKVAIDFEWGDGYLDILCTVKTRGVTGVEMEALTGASVAGLTIYDMCKGIDKGMSIDTRLLQKSGGKSGDWHA
jgi:cyclic pyranopterin phosphate synthase